jgi:hypothetical protein
MKTGAGTRGKPWLLPQNSSPSLPMSAFPDCPHLPVPREYMDWRDLSGHGETRDAEFYVTALEYGHFLWRRGQAARAILCLDRAFGADLRGDEPQLKQWPMPYAAMSWFLRHTPTGVFMGNPRVHFQHYAGRMNEPRREQRRWRAWACWAITRELLPHLPNCFRICRATRSTWWRNRRTH